MSERALGRLVVDLASVELTAREIERLRDPRVAGVILFRRNFCDAKQLAELTAAVRRVRSNLLIAADQEGGRVQRFVGAGFTRLPSMRVLGRLWDESPVSAREAARAVGSVMAVELLARGIDLSFMPVLDIDFGRARAIGNRALHRQPGVVIELAGALIASIHEQGMCVVGKHYPGHGFVEADSHVDVPIDRRRFDELWVDDLRPYRSLRVLDAVMPAHVIYPEMDSLPSGFSPFWLQTILRERIGFAGAVFSDDLTMDGARVVGGLRERVDTALAAGCDAALVCNHPDMVDDLLCSDWRPRADFGACARLAACRVKPEVRDQAVRTLDAGELASSVATVLSLPIDDGEADITVPIAAAIGDRVTLDSDPL